MMFFCVCIYINISMAHYWHTRTTRDQSGRRIERSTSTIGLPETASWLSRRWRWTANSESNQGMGAIVFHFFHYAKWGSPRGVFARRVSSKHTTHTRTHAHTRASVILRFFLVYSSIDQYTNTDAQLRGAVVFSSIDQFKTDCRWTTSLIYFVFMTTRIIWNYLFIFIFLVSQLTTTGRVG